MNLLIDTHVFIWWETDAKRLSANAHTAITNPKNVVYLSIVSIWEMQIKTQLGKMTLSEPLPTKIARQREQNGMQLLSVLPEHIYQLSQLTDHHRDPFDRLLIAQTHYEQMRLVTSDSAIQSYDVPMLW